MAEKDIFDKIFGRTSPPPPPQVIVQQAPYTGPQTVQPPYTSEPGGYYPPGYIATQSTDPKAPNYVAPPQVGPAVVVEPPKK